MYMYKREKIKNLTRSILCVAALCAPAAVFGADYSCDTEDNMVNPALALCSTHVYNIGQTQNPSGSADKETMKEVIALKTTIMTQQMYKQYEYLESMIKRFKTQLEKAVLNAKLESAGAGTGNSSSSAGTSSSFNLNDKYVVLDGARNCNNETGGTLAIYECLQSNISTVLSAIDNNKSSEARRQLESDIKVATGWDITKPTECGSLSGANRIRDCAYSLSRTITRAKEKFEADNRKLQYGAGVRQ